MEEENVQVPRGDLDMPGHHLFMIASFDGNCYLVNKESGDIYGTFPTNGFLRIANRGEDVVDYADLKPGDPHSELYHYRSNRPKPQLIPFESKDTLKDYFNGGGVGTDVSMSETYYVIDYQTRRIIRSFDSYAKAVGNNVFENEDWLDHFIINRVDFYLHRSSPYWSLRFARINAWFPDNRGKYRNRTQCFVYHAPDSETYINACIDFKLNRFPRGCAINRLIMDKQSLSWDNIQIQEENTKLKNEISKLHALLSRNSRIDLTLLNGGKFIKKGDDGSQIFKGTYDRVEALIEKASRGSDDSELRKKIHRLRSSAYHPNICTFLGWQSDDKHDYFAYEKCQKSLRDYINDRYTRYEEMSDQSMKIMSGLVYGISHLHKRDLLHKNLSLDNIWVSGDKSGDMSIKIGGVGNSEILVKNDEVRRIIDRRIDLYEVGEAILAYMTKGKHKPLSNKTALSAKQFKDLKIRGENKEVLDLLQKLHIVQPERLTPSEDELCNHISFWPALKRLRYFQDLSSYLDETVPRPTNLRKAINKLQVVPLEKNVSDWMSMFTDGVFEAMVKVPEKSGQPKESPQDPSQAKQGPKEAESSKQEIVYYNSTNVSLIRFMRNGFTHIESFSSRKTVGERTLAEDLGSNASEFEATFRKLFPDLFVLVHAEVEKHLDELPDLLKKHYKCTSI